MKKTLYDRLIKPRSEDTNDAQREIVLNYLLLGFLTLSVVALADTILVTLITPDNFLLARMVAIGITLCCLGSLYALARTSRYFKFVALVVVGLAVFLGTMTAYQWGVLLPTGVLLFSSAIVMAGVLINARSAIYTAVICTVIVGFLQHGESSGSLHPNLEWMGQRPTIGDTIGLAAILFVIALVSWLFNRQMELSLKRALRSEQALQRQKDLLEVKVEQRARQLEANQLEKMQEIYRFAELGRLSTGLLHDLANHLSSLNIDIEGMHSKDQSEIMQRISRNIGHIDTIVRRVRQQIRGKGSVEVFNIHQEIDEVVKILTTSARQAGIEIKIKADKSVKPSLAYRGDVIRFRQIIINLISNGIEAYTSEKSAPAAAHEVHVRLSRQQTTLSIDVSDNGVGISPEQQKEIFSPFYTTKAEGSGIGLYLVKQIVEEDFNGTIGLTSQPGATTFTVTIPRTYYVSSQKH